MDPRRQFDLPSFDVEYLATTSLVWETIIETETRWLLLHERPVPAGYNHGSVQTALQVAPGYPDAQIDMVYFYPALARVDGKLIGALASQRIDEKEFQRWSRHRTGESAWRAGVDDVSSHLALVDDWLARELRKA